VAKLLLLNKPYGVLSQFTDREAPGGQPRPTLADYVDAPGFRVAGRLDYDSEGLLLLTDDGRLQQLIANPRHKQWKTYLVQVEGLPSDEALELLASGVALKDGPTRPASVKRLEAPELWPRNPPIRSRQQIADSWLQLSIREGRNRQVRRMTAAVDHPTLRLVRTHIGDWTLGDLQPGQWREETIHMSAAPARRPPRGKKR